MLTQMDGWTDGQMGGWIYSERNKTLLAHNTMKIVRQHVKKTQKCVIQITVLPEFRRVDKWWD